MRLIPGGKRLRDAPNDSYIPCFTVDVDILIHLVLAEEFDVHTLEQTFYGRLARDYRASRTRSDTLLPDQCPH